MNIHEYQAKELLRSQGIEVPPFAVASNLNEVEQVLDREGWDHVVLKIQVHAGGRGKAGGVKLVKGKAAILETAKQLIGMKMVNTQTGSEGVVAQKLLIAPPCSIDKEEYLSIVVDRSQKKPIIIASPEGGMDIEEVAAKTPEKILKLPVDRDGYIPGYRLMRLAKFMGWQGDLAKKGAKLVKQLAKAFVALDASMLEINPLVQSGGEFIILDTKIGIDDNALFRQKAVADCYDPSQLPQREVQAQEIDLAYIALDGSIGCMVNGAGLAMATMDIIKRFGGDPANFLDVGGSATKEKIVAGFKIILTDPRVKGIFVNIFGGIMDCSLVAESVIAAVEELSLESPLVVRLEGTNADKGRKLLEESSLHVIPAASMDEGAKKIIQAIGG